jgi:hypothetical protein
MSTPEYSEEELRALEAEMDKITVDDVLLQTVVSLINLGARRIGAGGGAGGPEPREPDVEQVQQAIEGARALLPLLEQRHAEQLAPVKDALSRLQMAYVQRRGGPPQPGPETPQPPGDPGEPGQGSPDPDQGPGPAQRSGRLWVPGQ